MAVCHTDDLIRNLLLIADKVPPSDDNWYSILVFIKLKIALFPVVTPDTLPYLKVLAS